MTFFTEKGTKIPKHICKYKICEIIQTIPTKVAGDIMGPIPSYTPESRNKNGHRGQWDGMNCMHIYSYDYSGIFYRDSKISIEEKTACQ